ncbi:MAG TPA: PAS domain-containing protein [Dongiaceae bacterium]|nr:PAS domain-containing protein [Dongiaceae bacterium]
MDRTARDLNRVVTGIAATVAAATAVSVPAIYFFTALIGTQEALQDEAGEAAQAVSHFAFVNPRLWRFETLRITERLAQRHGLDSIALRVLDATGDMVAEYRGSSGALAAPTIVRTAAIVESQQAVGTVEAVVSLRPVLFGTALAALPGLGLALAGFVALRTLPLRALTNASRRLVAARDELAASNALLTREVAEHRQTEQTLRASEARLARAQKLARLGHWVAAPVRPDVPWESGLDYSAAAAAIFGVAPEELAISDEAYVGRFVHPDDQERVRQRFRDHVERRRRSEPLEYRIVRPDGAARDIVEVSEDVVDDDGAALYVIGTVQDVTDLRRAEAALRVSEARLAKAQRQARIWYWQWDIARRETVYYSPGMAEAIGAPAATAMVKLEAWIDFIHPDDQEAVRAFYENVDDNPRNYELDYRMIGVDGVVRHIREFAELERDEAGRPRAYTGTLQDITQVKQLEERLLQAQKMEAVGQLTSGVAHDFNNLLTAVLGNLELLRDRVGPEADTLRLIDTGLRAAWRGSDLTQRLLAFARRQALNPEVTDLNELVPEMVDLLHRTLGAEIEIETALADELWPASVDRSQLENAVLNLAINARDAMPDGGKLAIETGNVVLDEAYARGQTDLTPGEYVRLAVSDTGFGMSPEVQQHAFEPFFTTKEVGRGSGLGLSMVYGFVKQSGGHVRIYSEPGHGTTVKLYLPRAHQGRPAEPTARAPAHAESGNGETVLIVEDDADVRGFVTTVLARRGYRVIEAADGPAALARLDTHPDVDLLLTDVILPGGMNGRQVAEAVAARCPRVGVLYTSGYAENVIVHQGKLDPGVHLLAKPYRKEDLLRLVRKILDADKK